jgi:hypothetical protein
MDYKKIWLDALIRRRHCLTNMNPRKQVSSTARDIYVELEKLHDHVTDGKVIRISRNHDYHYDKLFLPKTKNDQFLTLLKLTNKLITSVGSGKTDSQNTTLRHTGNNSIVSDERATSDASVGFRQRRQSIRLYILVTFIIFSFLLSITIVVLVLHLYNVLPFWRLH